MHKRKGIILIIALVILVSGMAIAGFWGGWITSSKSINEIPDAKEEFKHILDRFVNESTIDIGGMITLYDGENAATVKERTMYRFIKRQDQFYSQLSFMQSFCDGKVVVQLDTVNQVIIVAEAVREKGKQKSGMLPALDVLFNEKADFKITGRVIQKNRSERSILFQDDFRPEIKSYELTYDPETYQVKSAVIKWWKDGGAVMERTDGNQVWVSKIEYQQQPKTDINIAEEINKIITIKKDQVQLASKYQDFQLHVTIPEQ